MDQLSPSSTSSFSRVQPPRRRPRKPLNCDPCRHSKLKCDRQLPCNTCLKRGWQDSCAYGSNFTGPRGRRKTRTSNVEPTIQAAEPRFDTIVTQPQPQIQVQPQEAASSPSRTPEPIQERWDTILQRPLVERRPIGPDSQRPTVTLSLGPIVPIEELLLL
ncbi:unnamed protein product [Fusarium langsethiae]|nr:unnamed protein product [Fusarium langsethiae]